MKTLKDILVAIGFIAVICGLFYDGFNRPKEVVKIQFETDTLLIRDTIIAPVPVPERIWIVRVDTVFVSYMDTLFIPVPIPVERKEYKTAGYHAVIEGYKASLLSMEVYPLTKIVTNTQIKTEKTKPRWGIGVQAGYGFTADKPMPYIGVGLQYNLVTF